MKRLNNPNLQMIETAVHRLGALVDEFVFITKLEAFEGRGKADFQMSHDIEDLVAVLDGRPLIVDEVLSSETMLRAALADRFIKLLGNPRFLDAVHGHLPTDRVSQARVSIVINRMEQIAALTV